MMSISCLHNGVSEYTLLFTLLCLWGSELVLVVVAVAVADQYHNFDHLYH